VPGLQSKWSTLRLITRSETSFLLRRLGYQLTATGSWEPPFSIVAGGFLRQRYESLDSLCEALRCLGGDLQTPPNEFSRRRKQESAITSLQFMALRLRMAEGFTEADLEHDSDSRFAVEEGSSPSTEPSSTRIAGNEAKKLESAKKQGNELGKEPGPDTQEKPSKRKKINPMSAPRTDFPLISFKKKKKRKNISTKANEASNDGTSSDNSSQADPKIGPELGHGDRKESDRLAPEEKTKKGKAKKRKQTMSQETRGAEMVREDDSSARVSKFGHREEQELALTPSRIKVGEFRGNPRENPAPWALDVPDVHWNTYLKMGFDYQYGFYYLPGESFKNYSVRYSKIEDIQVHVCTSGNYEPYLDRLESREERKKVMRHFNYAHVPGRPHEWRELRRLNLHETVLFLNLLGFERKPGRFGWWSVPVGVPILEYPSYPTLRELGEALVRVPDLEDRTMGMSNRRRSRMTDDDKLLNDHQMMALRLRIAEGLEEDYYPGESDKDKRPSEDGTAQPQKAEKTTEKLLFQISRNTIDQFIVDQNSHSRCWKSLENLGCLWQGGRYYLPGRVKSLDSQNELAEFVLVRGLNVLDWEKCTLDEDDIQALVKYMKSYHVRCSDSNLVEEAIKMITKKSITRYLGAIGIEERNDVYRMEDEKVTESEVVNMIRSNSDLYNLRENESSFMKRRRPGEDSLSTIEILALRLWAAFCDVPLRNMPDLTAMGNRKGKQIKICGTSETENRLESNHSSNDRAAIVTTTSKFPQLTSEKKINQSQVETSKITKKHLPVPSNDGDSLKDTDHLPQKPAIAKDSVLAKEVHAEPEFAIENEFEPRINTDGGGNGAENSDMFLDSTSSSNSSIPKTNNSNAPSNGTETTSLSSEATNEVKHESKSTTKDTAASDSPRNDSLDLPLHEASPKGDLETRKGTSTIAVPTESSAEIENNPSTSDTVVASTPEDADTSLTPKPSSFDSPQPDCARAIFATQDHSKDTEGTENADHYTKPKKHAVFESRAEFTSVQFQPTKENEEYDGERTVDLSSVADVKLRSPTISKNRHPNLEYDSPMSEACMGPEDFVTPKQHNGAHASSKRENDKPVAFNSETCPCFSTLAARSGAKTKQYGEELRDTLCLLTQPSFEGSDTDERAEDDNSIEAMDRPAKLDDTAPGFIIQTQESHDEDDWLDKELFS